MRPWALKSPRIRARWREYAFVDFDHAQYRFITAADALVAVDHREDLLKMDPYDGIDAVATADGSYDRAFDGNAWCPRDHLLAK